MKFLFLLFFLILLKLAASAQTNRYISADTTILYNHRPGTDSNTVLSVRQMANQAISYFNIKSDGSMIVKLDSSADGSYLLEVKPRWAHPDNVPFLIGIKENRQLPYGGSNTVFTMGWNIGLGGGAYIAGRPGFGVSWESNYHPDNDSVTQYVEAHEFYLAPNGQQIRVSSYTINTRGSNFFDFYHTVDRLVLKSKKNSNHTPVSLAIANDSTGQINFMGVGATGALVPYLLTTGAGTVSLGPSGARNSNFLFGFKKIFFGESNQLHYDSDDNRLIYAKLQGPVQQIRGGNDDYYGFHYDAGAPKFKVGADYNTGFGYAIAQGDSLTGYGLLLGALGRSVARFSSTGAVFGNFTTAPGDGPSPHAALEVRSTNKSLLLSRLTTAQESAIAWPEGSIWYNSDTKKFRGKIDTGIVDLH